MQGLSLVARKLGHSLRRSARWSREKNTLTAALQYFDNCVESRRLAGARTSRKYQKALGKRHLNRLLLQTVVDDTVRFLAYPDCVVNTAQALRRKALEQLKARRDIDLGYIHALAEDEFPAVKALVYERAVKNQLLHIFTDALSLNLEEPRRGIGENVARKAGVTVALVTAQNVENTRADAYR